MELFSQSIIRFNTKMSIKRVESTRQSAIELAIEASTISLIELITSIFFFFLVFFVNCSFLVRDNEWTILRSWEKKKATLTKVCCEIPLKCVIRFTSSYVLFTALISIWNKLRSNNSFTPWKLSRTVDMITNAKIYEAIEAIHSKYQRTVQK